MVLECNHQIINTPSLQRTTHADQALSCAEKILCWDFTADNSALFGSKCEVSAEKEKVAPRLPMEWKNLVTVPDVVHLFFKLAQLYGDEPSMFARTATCLVQLAAIQGPIFENQEVHRNYISFFMPPFRQFLSQY